MVERLFDDCQHLRDHPRVLPRVEKARHFRQGGATRYAPKTHPALTPDAACINAPAQGADIAARRTDFDACMGEDDITIKTQQQSPGRGIRTSTRPNSRDEACVRPAALGADVAVTWRWFAFQSASPAVRGQIRPPPSLQALPRGRCRRFPWCSQAGKPEQFRQCTPSGRA